MGMAAEWASLGTSPHYVLELLLTADHRFENREACDEVIKSFNNHTIEATGEAIQ